MHVFTKKIDKQPLRVLELKFSKKSLKGFNMSLALTALVIFNGTLLSRILFHDEILKLRGTINFTTITLTVVLFLLKLLSSKVFQKN